MRAKTYEQPMSTDHMELGESVSAFIDSYLELLTMIFQQFMITDTNAFGCDKKWPVLLQQERRKQSRNERDKITYKNTKLTNRNTRNKYYASCHGPKNGACCIVYGHQSHAGIHTLWIDEPSLRISQENHPI